MAVAILSASGQLRALPGHAALFGELALDGRLQRIPGAMALVGAAKRAGAREVIVPSAVAPEAAVVRGIDVHPAATLGDAVAHLAGVRPLAVAERTALPPEPPASGAPDLADVIGQELGRRALEIAVAGRHSLALCGPPGVGKTLLMRCASGVAPPLTDEEALDVSRIYSVAGLLDRHHPVVRSRPFRAPHHTVSTQGLVGGGPRVRPGEASLAHRGLLFLDEMLQFRADALDAFRQPVEAGTVTIARADGSLELPARFTLLAAFNPCPCGWFGDGSRACSCEVTAVRRYAARLSGPLRDRLDLLVWMPSQPRSKVRIGVPAESSAAVARRIRAAWARQLERQGVSNAELEGSALGGRNGISPAVNSTLAARGRQFNLSTRRVLRVARVARTIADLADRPNVTVSDIDEAVRYRADPWA